MTKKLYSVVLRICVLSLAAVNPVQADEALDDGWERCIHTILINRTVVVDDQSILFYMNGKVIYHNSLPRRCPGLGFEKRFSYRSSVGKLCRIDTISVLRSGGSGLDSGASCGLGLFRQIDEEEAQMIREKTDRVPEPQQVPPPAPQAFPPPEPQSDPPPESEPADDKRGQSPS